MDGEEIVVELHFYCFTDGKMMKLLVALKHFALVKG